MLVEVDWVTVSAVDEMGSFGVVGWAWLVFDALLSQGCVWFDVGVSEGAGRVGEAGSEQDVQERNV